VSGKQQACINWLHLEENYYNTTHHMSIGMIPFKALYGYDAPSFVSHTHYGIIKFSLFRKGQNPRSPTGA
jgi:hypothetical protein